MLFFRLQDPAFSDRIQPGASNCWTYGEPTSRPTAPAAAAFHPLLSSAHRPHLPGSNTLPGNLCILTVVAATGYQRCVFQKLNTFNGAQNSLRVSFDQVVLRINSIFEARVGKKHLRRIYHYAETSSGRGDGVKCINKDDSCL